MFAAQCLVNQVRAGFISSTVLRISWKCSDPEQTSEFTVTHTLINKDHCSAPDDSLNLRNDCSSCNRAETDNVGEYSYFYDLTELHPYSTYTYSVQARITTVDGNTRFETPVDGSSPFTTAGAGEFRPHT